MIYQKWICEVTITIFINHSYIDDHLIQAMDILTYNATVMNKIMQRRPNGLP